MAQKIYQKASVQTAFVSGVFLLLGIAIPYYFKIPKLQDQISKIVKENTDKTAEIQRLETQLTPFKTIALEKYTGSEQEALRKLANELEKLKNDIDPLKKPISYAIAEVEVIVDSNEQIENTLYMSEGGLLTFVKGGQSLLLVSDTKSTAIKSGKGSIIYKGNFQIQSNYSQIGKPVKILQESDLIQIQFNKISENSNILGGKASIVINGDLRFDFKILPQQMQGNIILIRDIKNKFVATQSSGL